MNDEYYSNPEPENWNGVLTWAFFENFIEELRQEIEKIEEESKWIQVTERLPEPRQEVLFLSEGDRKFWYYVKSAHWNTEYWYSWWWYFPWKITHWMPLPPHP